MPRTPPSPPASPSSSSTGRGRQRRRARRRARHARDGAARSGADRRRHRRHRAVRRLGFRARCRLRRAGLSARAGPRLPHPRRAWCRSCPAPSCSTCSMAATRTGAAIRPIASLATPLRRAPRSDFALGSVRRRPRRHHRQSQGRPRLGLGDDARRHHRRRAGRRQRGRHRDRRRRPALLGGAVRAKRRIRRPWLVAAADAVRPRHPRQRRAAREHHHRCWSPPTRSSPRRRPIASP